MHAFTVDHQRDGAYRRRWQLLHRGFFLHGTPRLMLWCRLLGHRPVIDGTDPSYSGSRSYRWVACDRCGVRGNPQGNLDPATHHIGDRYQGPYGPTADRTPAGREYLRTCKGGFHPPGPIPMRGDAAQGDLGGELVLGPGGLKAFAVEVKVGNPGSEHTLAARLCLGPLGALYLHTQRHGAWLQRRLNPVGCESRLIGVDLCDGILSWRLWSRRDSGGRYGPHREPWWMRTELDLRVRDRLLGPARYAYRDVGDKVNRVVRMPEGDYLVTLQLQRQTYGRRRGRKRYSWCVDWDTTGGGIPTRGTDRGRICGSGVKVTEAAVKSGSWPAQAVAAITSCVVADRVRYHWDPTGLVPVDVDQVMPACTA